MDGSALGLNNLSLFCFKLHSKKKNIENIAKLKTEKVISAYKEKIKRTVENITVNNTFSPNNFWNLCKKARKEATMSVVMEDGHEIFGEMIRNAYKQEFQHRQRKKRPK